MKPKKLFLFATFLIFFAFQNLFAQNPPIKWGKVAQEDLDMTVYSQDSSADAIVLADYGHLKFDFTGNGTRFLFHRHRRIKILRRSAFSRGDVSISYYGEDRISGLKAQIINPDGSKQSIKKSEIFEEEVTAYWQTKKFTFPNLQEGSIIEYSYDLYSPYYFQLKEWYFQEDIPVRWSEYQLEIPEWFNYVVLSQACSFDIKNVYSANSNLSLPGVGLLNTKMLMSRYAMANVPALQEENYITTMDDYLARLRFQLRSYQFPDSAYEPVLSNRQTAAEELIGHNNFGAQFLKRRNFKSLSESMQPLIATASNDDEKVSIIYQALADQIKWDGTYSYMTKEKLDDCFELKEANSGELNLMLIALLKEQGITANPVLISTRSHGKMIAVYPMLSQFNHAVALVEIDNESMIIDVNNPYSPKDFPRIEALNGGGWLVHKSFNRWIDLESPQNNEAGMVQISVDEAGNLEGVFNQRLKGYDAADHREQIQEDAAGKFIKKALTEQYPDIQIKSINIENETDPNKQLRESVEFTLPYGAQVAGDFLYLSPVLFSGFDENPFKAETRSYPVNMPYPIIQQYVLMLDLPEGYAIEEMPENLHMVLPNKGANFTYSVKVLGNKLQVNSLLKITQLMYEPEEYPTIKGFFEMMIEKQAEQIVLKKKT